MMVGRMHSRGDGMLLISSFLSRTTTSSLTFSVI